VKKRLSKKAFERAVSWIMEKGRKLEKSWVKSLFFGTSPGSVLQEIQAFQNPDGGFGKALESDLRFPGSSAIATSVALENIHGLLQMVKTDKERNQGMQLVKGALGFLETDFSPARQGWFATPAASNGFPHTPWWHVEPGKGCAIDEHWGNPSAELTGYCLLFRQNLSRLNVDALSATCMEHFSEVDSFSSFHELFCYARLYRLAPSLFCREMEERLFSHIQAAVEPDFTVWQTEYVARPLDFVDSPHETLGIFEEWIDQNLDTWVEELESLGKLLPHWPQSFYSEEMAPAWDEWTGVCTLKALKVLKNFGRL